MGDADLAHARRLAEAAGSLWSGAHLINASTTVARVGVSQGTDKPAGSSGLLRPVGSVASDGGNRTATSTSYQPSSLHETRVREAR